MLSIPAGTNSTRIGYDLTPIFFVGTVDFSSCPSRHVASAFPCRAASRLSTSTVNVLRALTIEQRIMSKYSWEQEKKHMPLLVKMQARAYHSAVRCGRKVWVIGGSDASVVFNDTWVLDTVTLSWEKVPVRWGPIPEFA